MQHLKIELNCGIVINEQTIKMHGLDGIITPMVLALKRELISKLSTETIPENCALYLTFEELV